MKSSLNVEFVTAREAAEILGLTAFSIYAMAKSGRLPAYTFRHTRSLRFKRADVVATLTRRTLVGGSHGGK